MKLIKFKGQKDYDKINHLPFNREYNLRPSLVESMKNKGFIDAISLCYSTAFGTKELYLLDGQHRALAANYLNIEFYGNVNEKIIETKEELVELVATYNNTSVCWELITYVKAYIALNYEDYVELYKVSKENGFSVKTIASLFINYLLDGGGNPVARQIKHGKFIITNRENTYETLRLAKILDCKLNNSMLISFHKLRLTDSNFDFELFKAYFQNNYLEIKATTSKLYDELFSNYTKQSI